MSREIKVFSENIEVNVGSFEMKSDGLYFDVSLDGKPLLDVSEVLIKATMDEWVEIKLTMKAPFKRDAEGNIELWEK